MRLLENWKLLTLTIAAQNFNTLTASLVRPPIKSLSMQVLARVGHCGVSAGMSRDAFSSSDISLRRGGRGEVSFRIIPQKKGRMPGLVAHKSRIQCCTMEHVCQRGERNCQSTLGTRQLLPWVRRTYFQGTHYYIVAGTHKTLGR